VQSEPVVRGRVEERMSISNSEEESSAQEDMVIVTMRDERQRVQLRITEDQAEKDFNAPQRSFHGNSEDGGKGKVEKGKSVLWI